MTKTRVSAFESLKERLKRLFAYLAPRRMKEAAVFTLLQWLLGMAYRLQKLLPADEYAQIGDGETIDINWRDREAVNISCCDCGLVHYTKFFAAGDKIRMKLWRNEEETERQRDNRGITVE